MDAIPLPLELDHVPPLCVEVNDVVPLVQTFWIPLKVPAVKLEITVTVLVAILVHPLPVTV